MTAKKKHMGSYNSMDATNDYCEEDITVASRHRRAYLILQYYPHSKVHKIGIFSADGDNLAFSGEKPLNITLMQASGASFDEARLRVINNFKLSISSK